MDILNWIYLKSKNLIKTTFNNSSTDLLVLGADVGFNTKGDSYQSYGMTISDFLNQTKSGLYAQTALGTLITNTTVESSLIGAGVGTLSVPPNTFKVGDSFTARICGYLSCANAATIHFRVKSNGTVIGDAGVFAMKITTNKFFELNLDFTITKIGVAGVAELFTNGQYSYNHDSQGDLSGNNFASVNNNTFNTTIVNTLSVTAQWGAATTSDKIQSQNFVLTKVY